MSQPVTYHAQSCKSMEGSSLYNLANASSYPENAIADLYSWYRIRNRLTVLKKDRDPGNFIKSSDVITLYHQIVKQGEHVYSGSSVCGCIFSTGRAGKWKASFAATGPGLLLSRYHTSCSLEPYILTLGSPHVVIANSVQILLPSHETQ